VRRPAKKGGISGKNANDFNHAYGQWAQGGHVEASDTGSNWFTHDTSYAINPALGDVTGNHDVTKGITTALALPFGSWVGNAPTTAEKTVGVTGATVTTKALTGTLYVTSTGPTIGGIIILLVILAAIVIGIFLLIRNRRAVAERIRTVRGNIDAALTEQRLLAGAANLCATPVGDRGSVFNARPTPASAAHGSVLTIPDQQVARRHGSLLDVGAGGHKPGRRPTLLGDATDPNRNSLLA